MNKNVARHVKRRWWWCTYQKFRDETRLMKRFEEDDEKANGDDCKTKFGGQERDSSHHGVLPLPWAVIFVKFFRITHLYFKSSWT